MSLIQMALVVTREAHHQGVVNAIVGRHNNRLCSTGSCCILMERKLHAWMQLVWSFGANCMIWFAKLVQFKERTCHMSCNGPRYLGRLIIVFFYLVTAYMLLEIWLFDIDPCSPLICTEGYPCFEQGNCSYWKDPPDWHAPFWLCYWTCKLTGRSLQVP